MNTNAICSVCGETYRTRYQCQTCKLLHAPQPIVWRSLTRVFMYGWHARIGNRYAEVARCYSGEWTTFCFVDSKMRTGKDNVEPFQSAKKRATAFLRSEA